jgi:hypothetical protein
MRAGILFGSLACGSSGSGPGSSAGGTDSGSNRADGAVSLGGSQGNGGTTGTGASSGSGGSAAGVDSGGGSFGSDGAVTESGSGVGVDSGRLDSGPGIGVDGGSPNPNFYIFLLVGQSNMEGQPQPQAQDLQEDPRVSVLAYDNCPNLGRTYDQWYTARPPLHSCFAGVGPGDYFAKAMANAYPNARIGLVPCAISGVDVDFFRKGVVSARRSEFRIPPDNHWAGAYEFVIERARLAQQSGVIRGILFHQGESDTGSPLWVGKVQQIVADLRADLGLGNAPFLAGELLYGGCCASHNPLVDQLPSQIPSAYVISAAGLLGIDVAHFDLPGQRELGGRYGTTMLGVFQP